MRYRDLENSTQVIVKVVLAGLVLAFLWVIRDIVIILLLAMVLASAMEPLVDYLNSKKIPRAVSIISVYLLMFSLVGLVIFLIIPPMLAEFKNLQANLPTLTEELRQKMPYTHLLFGNADLSGILSQAFSVMSGGSSVLSRTLGLFNGFFTIITVLVISFYLVAEERGMKQLIRSLVPARHQNFTVSLVAKIQKKMGMWVLGQLILSAFIFVFTFIGLSILHVKYALFLALLAGLLEIIPYIGPFVSAIPALFVALVQSPATAFATLILYILVQKVEGYVLVPKVMEKTIGTSPLIVLFALLIGFKLAGILGLLLAVPIAAAILVIVHEVSANHPTE